MASPFPGMDPYLESTENWRSFHHHLADEIARQLNPQITPKYFADVEVRAVLQEVGIADAAVLKVAPQASVPQRAAAVLEAPIQRVVELPAAEKLRAVNIYELATMRLVTAIEILSPINKTGDGLQKYRRKRERFLRSEIHLIELDLLRRGERPGLEVLRPPLDTDYVILLNRDRDGGVRRSEIWPVALNEPLPTIPVPLLTPDPDAQLNLATVFAQIYTDFYYALRIDYKQPVPSPELRPAMKTWLAKQPR